MDLVAIDIGNTNISVGVFDEGELKKTEHLSGGQPERLPEIFREYRTICGDQPHGARTVPFVVSSVNPAHLKLVEKALLDTFNQDIKLIGRDFPLDMKVGVLDVDSVGSDRLLTALAAYQVVQNAVVIADFGTATTIDLVNDNGIFLGGVIMPGLNLAARALNDYTAALPTVKPVVPEGNYGVDTVSAIQNGIYYSAVGSLREVVERYATEIGVWPQVVATGGFSNMIAQKCDFIDSLVPNLCLDGLYLAYCNYCDLQDYQESDQTP